MVILGVYRGSVELYRVFVGVLQGFFRRISQYDS